LTRVQGCHNIPPAEESGEIKQLLIYRLLIYLLTGDTYAQKNSTWKNPMPIIYFYALVPQYGFAGNG
jgi:hypothetical protein